jgi:hypothetical protein
MRGLLIAVLLSACGGGSAPPNIDAHPGGPLCSKQLYDKCLEEHDCDTGACTPFPEYQICSTSCSAATPCPADKSGSPATCDPLGICKPSAPNMCHLPGQ